MCSAFSLHFKVDFLSNGKEQLYKLFNSSFKKRLVLSLKKKHFALMPHPYLCRVILCKCSFSHDLNGEEKNNIANNCVSQSDSKNKNKKKKKNTCPYFLKFLNDSI